MTAYMDITTNAAVIPTIIAAKTLGKLASNMSLARVVNRDYDNEVASYGRIVSIGKRAALTANNKATNTDVTVQDPTTTTVSVTLDKHKEVTLGEEDIAAMFSRPELMDGYAEDAALVILEAIEGDLAGLYSGLSQSIDATTGGLNEDDFRNAQRLLNAAKASQANRWAVLHEDAFSEAMALDKVINSDYQGAAGPAALQMGAAGYLYGFNISMNQNIATATSECKNLFIQRDALTLVSRPMRKTTRRNVEQVVMVENGISLRVTLSYDAKGLAEVMTIDTLYGVAELRDEVGVVVRTTEV